MMGDDSKLPNLHSSMGSSQNGQSSTGAPAELTHHYPISTNTVLLPGPGFIHFRTGSTHFHCQKTGDFFFYYEVWIPKQFGLIKETIFHIEQRTKLKNTMTVRLRTLLLLLPTWCFHCSFLKSVEMRTGSQNTKQEIGQLQHCVGGNKVQ